MDKYELEMTRLKEKLNELEFYRARVEELRTDNSALLDTNQQLSDQLSSCHKRIEALVDLENDIAAYKQQLALCVKVSTDESWLIVHRCVFLQYYTQNWLIKVYTLEFSHSLLLLIKDYCHRKSVIE